MPRSPRADLGQENVQVIADALAPMAHAGALVQQGVLEELLAGEVLEIGIVHPAVPETSATPMTTNFGVISLHPSLFRAKLTQGNIA